MLAKGFTFCYKNGKDSGRLVVEDKALSGKRVVTQEGPREVEMFRSTLSLPRKLLLVSPIGALVLNLLILPPPQQSSAALEQPSTKSLYGVTPEEWQNMNVYQNNIAAVVSIRSGDNQGAGVILTPDGLVVTNKHVIRDDTLIHLRTTAGQEYKAKLIAYGGVNRDLAFLQILGNGRFPHVRMGDSATVRVGQKVYAIGSPFGLDGTLTTGIVSRIDARRNMIQTDAAINPGNSGGPLLNIHGDLIGINRSIVNPVGASSAGVSFAVPVNVVKQEIAQIKQRFPGKVIASF